jgi:hypothetical protein
MLHAKLSLVKEGMLRLRKDGNERQRVLGPVTCRVQRSVPFVIWFPE